MDIKESSWTFSKNQTNCYFCKMPIKSGQPLIRKEWTSAYLMDQMMNKKLDIDPNVEADFCSFYCYNSFFKNDSGLIYQVEKKPWWKF